MKNSTEKKYDTDEKKIKFLRTKGNIITFKEKFYPTGMANPGRLQIIVCSIEKARNGSIKYLARSMTVTGITVWKNCLMQ